MGNSGGGAALPSKDLCAAPADMPASPALAQQCWLRTIFRLSGTGTLAPTLWPPSLGDSYFGMIRENLGSCFLPCLTKKEAAEIKRMNNSQAGHTQSSQPLKKAQL